MSWRLKFLFKYQSEKDEKSRDVANHSAEGDLQRTKDLEGGHQVCCSSDAEDVCDGEQDVWYDLWIVRSPIESHCKTNKISTFSIVNPRHPAPPPRFPPPPTTSPATFKSRVAKDISCWVNFGF